MQTILSIKTTLYKLLNVTSITSVIGGQVYRGTAPNESSLDNVEIIAGANVNDIAQVGTVFVNYHVRDKNDGQPDEAKMSTFAAALVAIIEAQRDWTMIDEQVFKNVERPGWAYYSARINVTLHNDAYVE